MSTEQPLEQVQGTGEARLRFEEIDQHFRLKIRAFIHLCMPPIFTSLEREFQLRALRQAGIAPIMFYQEFESTPRPLAFGGRVELPFSIRLCRSVAEAPSGNPAATVERLLLDMHSEVLGQEGSGDPLEMGALEAGATGGAMVPAGRMHGVHVLTRPTAPPGERQVTEVPDPLRALRVHPWEAPYPSSEQLQGVPAGYRRREAGPWHEQRSVWGLHNTDINQHVNVHEYIHGMENHFSRLLFGANLPGDRHSIGKAAFLFRKPFFSGQPYGLRGSLWLHGEQTLMQASFHHIEPEGGLEPQPSVFARLEGAIGERS